MNDRSVFDEIKDALAARPLTTKEICGALGREQKEILAVLRSNPYSFDFSMVRFSKVWRNI